jgi:hypothetical protein
VGQRHALVGFGNLKDFVFTIFAIFSLGRIRLCGVPPRFEGRLTLGYTEAHQPFQRRLVDAEDDSPAGVLAEE